MLLARVFPAPATGLAESVLAWAARALWRWEPGGQFANLIVAARPSLQCHVDAVLHSRTKGQLSSSCGKLGCDVYRKLFEGRSLSGCEEAPVSGVSFAEADRERFQQISGKYGNVERLDHHGEQQLGRN